MGECTLTHKLGLHTKLHRYRIMFKSVLGLIFLMLSEAKLPSTYYASSVKGKFKKGFSANSYGCSVAWYTDKGKWGYPYCPGDTIEVHSDFDKLNAKSRDNSGYTNHVLHELPHLWRIWARLPGKNLQDGLQCRWPP